MVIFKVLTLTMLLISTSSFAKINVWIDYDVSIGKKFSDVDDGIALIAAINSPSLNVEGISYSFGNTNDLEHMKKITDEILLRYKRQDIPVYRGAAKPADLFQKNKAVDALAQKLRHKKLSILSMGRMTTVAGLALHYPELISKVDQVIVNLGRRLETETMVGSRRVIMPDTNVDGDIESTKILLKSGVKVVLIPTELMADQFIHGGHLRSLREGTQNAKWLYKKLKLWKFIWTFYPGTNGFIPWDLFIVGYLTAPQDFTCDEFIPIDFKRLPNNTSRIVDSIKTKHKDFVVASHSLESNNLGTYCHDVDDSHIGQWIEQLRKL